MGWKLFFSLIPPRRYAGGWFAFVIALCMIGIVTAIVGEVANLFGCAIGLKPAITAITFVALGTSLPDTFASMQAAKQSKYADSAIGNVTGSNCVNVFLGLGLPWFIATIYKRKNEGTDYNVPAGDLAFSVMLFLIVSVICIIVIIIRRYTVGGELGGSNAGKYASGFFLICLWLFYIIMSIAKVYGAL